MIYYTKKRAISHDMTPWLIKFSVYETNLFRDITKMMPIAIISRPTTQDLR